MAKICPEALYSDRFGVLFCLIRRSIFCENVPICADHNISIKVFNKPNADPAPFHRLSDKNPQDFETPQKLDRLDRELRP